MTADSSQLIRETGQITQLKGYVYLLINRLRSLGHQRSILRACRTLSRELIPADPMLSEKVIQVIFNQMILSESLENLLRTGPAPEGLIFVRPGPRFSTENAKILSGTGATL